MSAHRRPDRTPPVPPPQADLFLSPERLAPPVERLMPNRRLAGLRLVISGILLLLLLQGLRLQVAGGFLFRREAEGNRVRALIEYAPRGIFLDRQGQALVQNVPAMELIADPAHLPDDLEPVFVVFQDALPTRDLTRLRAVLQRLRGDARTDSPLTLLQGLTHEEFLALASRADQLPGLHTEATAVRAYRGAGAFAHVLGYTGKLSPEERAAFPTYLLTEALGKSGLERQYQSVLRGAHGARRVEVDALGAVQHDLGRQPPVPGAHLRLHLDAALQERVATALARGLQRAGVRRGAAVALDPFSGAVRALVSFPLFPHSAFARGLDPQEAAAVLGDPASPLLNRVTQGRYVPGSTFKLTLAAGALEEGIVTQDTTVESTGGIRVGTWFFPDWKPGGHGRTDLRKALAESVNTYFYAAGGGVEEAAGLGIERMTTWAGRLGIGASTGIDLPEERAGFLPSPAWKEQQKHEAWYIGDTYHAAIGQGDVLVTPLELAVATSVIANGGTLYAPRLLDAIEAPDGAIRERIPPAVRAERVIRPETAEAVQRGMRAAVTAGSAQGLRDLPVAAAAKTGTAQIGGTEKTHAWVTAFAPVEQPELVLVILLEEAGGGDRLAVPLARDIFAWYFSSGQAAARQKLNPQ